MDVDKSSFQPLLPSMLEAISTAHFIAIDLELSGIHKQPYRANPNRTPGGGKQTLQQRYKETKEAAERYQILQVGMTCVTEDTAKGCYVARPYNFNLNPLVTERLDVERVFSFQSGAVEFLLEHGFRLELPFLQGVPYLSRREEAYARKRALQRQDRSLFAEISIKEDDLESLRFLQQTRQEIGDWLGRTTSDPQYLNIAPAGSAFDHQSNRGLNNFQKRLVHQLVRAEFPDLVTVSRPSFIQIVAYDKSREDAIKQGKQRHFEEQLSRQIGLRWLIDAMCGGDLSAIDPRGLTRNAAGDSVFVDLKAATAHLDGIRANMKGRRTVLVGHNVFTDLVNLYHAFLGELPEQVGEFQQKLHALFPMVIDTKYLATRSCGSITPKSSLEEIAEDLSKQETPVLQIHPAHQKYTAQEAAHEAGYDSLLTATVLVKLSAKLAAEVPPTVLKQAKEVGIDATDGGVLLNAQGGGASPSKSRGRGLSLLDATNRQLGIGPTAGKGSPRRAQGFKAAQGAGMFDALIDLSDSEIGTAAESEAAAPPDTKLMPAFDTDFWKAYGNRLRVFGTQEEVCDLDARRRTLIEAESVRRSWSRLLDGECGIEIIRDRSPRFATLPSQVAGVVPDGSKADGGWNAREWLSSGDERQMATFSQYAVAASQEALDDANWKPATREEQENTGVCLGSGIGSLDDAYDTSVAFEKGGYKKVSPLFVPRLLINLAAGHGPNHAVTTACTTGAHAIGDASRFIAFGDVEVMVAGGAESCIHPLAVAGFARAKSLATEFNETPHLASRPFDRDRCGFVIGEGAGVLVLEELEHARARGARIYAEIKGYGTSADAFHMTAPPDGGEGAFLSMKRALKGAGVAPAAVDYVNAHATSTRLGDAAENIAIRELLLGEQGKDRASEVNVSSTKGATGHLLGAAGSVEAIFAILAVHEDTIPPTLNLDNLDDAGGAFDCNYVPHTAQRRRVEVALSNSFGFGGTNASLCFAKYRNDR
ncbi:MAG: Mitochondrial beta-keto-acyl synthase [Thelocarpon impressellum]|nr:MAG: Mitochondrial beta-keto-acyl synthase [Thelocarpon impressellum]